MPDSGNPSLEGKAYREFISEGEEILEQMRAGLADLLDACSDPGGDSAAGLRADGEVDPDLLNRVFRAAHSLKGLAGMFGLDSIGELAHHLEDVLDSLRLGRIAIDSPAIELLDSAVSVLARMLECVAHPDRQAQAEEADEAAAAKIEEIRRAVEGDASRRSQADGFEALALDPRLLRALTEYEEHRLRESIRRGRHLSLVDASFEMLCFEEGLAELSGAIREVGEVVSTLPSPGDSPESQSRFSLLVSTEISGEQLRARLEFAGTTVESVFDPENAQPSQPAPSVPRASSPHAAGVARQSEADAGSPTAGSPEHAARADAPEMESLRSISDTVRVDIRKLDELMNLVGDLVIQRTAIEQIAAKLSVEAATAPVGAELARAQKRLARKLEELQAGVLDVRMVPLRQIFQKLSRVVRRLRRDLDKQVAFDWKGGDTELDKLIVEPLADPLMHIVRNAIDHAIEPAAERASAGKPRQGSIRVDAFQRGNYVLIEVRDDGRGLDLGAIRARAEALDLVDPGAALSEKEVFDLLFLPGFSTRSQVSETSGRGVGMDVVRSNLNSLGGIVEIRSELGAGTVVTLTLPITLAIVRALLVGVGDHRYAIPLNSVLETLLVDRSEIQRSEGREILNLRGQPLILRRLREELALECEEGDPAHSRKHYVVVLGLGEMRVGLIVDRLAGQQDTVVKPIRGPIRQIRGVAGATEVGDQGAVLVLDIASIVEDAMRRKDAA